MGIIIYEPLNDNRETIEARGAAYIPLYYAEGAYGMLTSYINTATGFSSAAAAEAAMRTVGHPSVAGCRARFVAGDELTQLMREAERVMLRIVCDPRGQFGGPYFWNTQNRTFTAAIYDGSSFNTISEATSEARMLWNYSGRDLVATSPYVCLSRDARLSPIQLSPEAHFLCVRQADCGGKGYLTQLTPEIRENCEFVMLGWAVVSEFHRATRFDSQESAMEMVTRLHNYIVDEYSPVTIEIISTGLTQRDARDHDYGAGRTSLRHRPAPSPPTTTGFGRPLSAEQQAELSRAFAAQQSAHLNQTYERERARQLQTQPQAALPENFSALSSLEVTRHLLHRFGIHDDSVVFWPNVQHPWTIYLGMSMRADDSYAYFTTTGLSSAAKIPSAELPAAMRAITLTASRYPHTEIPRGWSRTSPLSQVIAEFSPAGTTQYYVYYDTVEIQPALSLHGPGEPRVVRNYLVGTTAAMLRGTYTWSERVREASRFDAQVALLLSVVLRSPVSRSPLCICTAAVDSHLLAIRSRPGFYLYAKRDRQQSTARSFLQISDGFAQQREFTEATRFATADEAEEARIRVANLRIDLSYVRVVSHTDVAYVLATNVPQPRGDADPQFPFTDDEDLWIPGQDDEAIPEAGTDSSSATDQPAVIDSVVVFPGRNERQRNMRYRVLARWGDYVICIPVNAPETRMPPVQIRHDRDVRVVSLSLQLPPPQPFRRAITLDES